MNFEMRSRKNIEDITVTSLGIEVLQNDGVRQSDSN